MRLAADDWLAVALLVLVVYVLFRDYFHAWLEDFRQADEEEGETGEDGFQN